MSATLDEHLGSFLSLMRLLYGWLVESDLGDEADGAIAEGDVYFVFSSSTGRWGVSACTSVETTRGNLSKAKIRARAKASVRRR